MFRAGFRAEAAKPVKRRCYLRKHRVTPCRKQRCAPFPARLEPPGATRGPALLPSPELPWDSEQEPGASRKPTPDHQISCFAPERIYVVRLPCAGYCPTWAEGPGRSIGADHGGLREWDAWLHGSRPHTAVDPYRPRTVRSRSARVPSGVGRRRRRTGGIPGAIRWCLRAFGTGFIGRRRKFSPPASYRPGFDASYSSGSIWVQCPLGIAGWECQNISSWN